MRSATAVLGALALLRRLRMRARLRGAGPYDVPALRQRARRCMRDCERMLADLNAAAPASIATPPEAAPTCSPRSMRCSCALEDTLGPLWLLAARAPGQGGARRGRRLRSGLPGLQQRLPAERRGSTRGSSRWRRRTPSTRRLQRDQLDAFEDSGVAPAAPRRRQRARAINTELTRLAQEFDRRIREDRDARGRSPRPSCEGVPADACGRRAARRAAGATCSAWTTRASTPVIAEAPTRRQHARAHVARHDAPGRRGQPEDAGAARASCAASTRALFGFDVVRRLRAAPAHGQERGRGVSASSPRCRRRCAQRELRRPRRCCATPRPRS